MMMKTLEIRGWGEPASSDDSGHRSLGVRLPGGGHRKPETIPERTPSAERGRICILFWCTAGANHPPWSRNAIREAGNIGATDSSHKENRVPAWVRCQELYDAFFGKRIQKAEPRHRGSGGEICANSQKGSRNPNPGGKST